MDGPPKTRAEMEWRLGDLDCMDRQMRRVRWILWALPLGLVAFLLLMGIRRELEPNVPPWDLAQWLILGILCLTCGCYVIILRFVAGDADNKIHAKRAQLSEWREHGAIKK